MWYFLKSTGYVLRGGYFTFTTKYLEPFHIPSPPNEKTEGEIIQLVEKILCLQKEFDEKHTKFLNRVQTQINTDKISKTMSKFYELSFETFLSSINAASTVKLNLKEQDDWEDYFESYKKDLIKLKTEIGKIDHDVNHLVYQLYGLSTEEIKIVEDNYPKI